MSMKKKLVLTSKILLGIFLLLFLVIIMDITYHPSGEAAEITAYVLFPFLLAGALMIIVFLVEFILELKEGWKEKGTRLVAELLGELLIVMAAVALYRILACKGEGTISGYLAVSAGIVVMAKVLDYWKRIRKS